MPHAASAAVLLLLCLSSSVRCSVKTCEQGQVWARGRELINAMRGQLVLVAFPMASDRVTLNKLSSLAESNPSVRVIALLDPSSCSIEEAAVMGRDWRWLVVDRDDVGSRLRLGLKPNEVALFDRCGRLSRTLSLTATEDLKQAVRAAQHHASCGWCQYGTESAGSGEGKVDKKLDAFFQQAIATQPPTQQRVYPHHQQQYNQQQQQQQHFQQNQMPRSYPSSQQHRQHPQQQTGQSYDPQHQQQQAAYQQQLLQRQQQQQYQGRTQQQTAASSPYRTQQSTMGQTPGHVTHSQIRPNEYAQRGITIPQTANAPVTTQSSPDDYGDYDEVMKGTPEVKEVDLRKPAFNEDAQWATSAPFYHKRQHKDLFAQPVPTTFSYSSPGNAGRKTKEEEVSTTTASKKAGTGFEEYTDYEDYGAMKTFPNSDEPEDKAVHMSRSTQTRPRSVDPRSYDHDPDEDEVPCKAITDDICYHQKKSGRKLSKCCKKGIYLADFCMPGKCSNTTVQACCMQKYLQAKFQCCENADMDGTTATDAFSRCCHAHFVEEVRQGTDGGEMRDDCCPPEAAAEYWQSVHDICLPNVQADLSTVKFEIRLSDGIRVLDLAETDKWQHECKYGGRRAQYVYVP